MDPRNKYIIERRQEDAKGDLVVIKKDFYDDLPRVVTSVLDEVSWRWRKYDWFVEAWNKYRDHVISSVQSGSAIKAPGFIFNPYIDDQIIKNFEKETEEMQEIHDCCPCMHSDEDLNNFLMHGGWIKDDVKGFVPKGTPGAHPTGTTGASEDSKETSSTEEKEKEWRAQIKRMQQENSDMKVVNEYNRNLKAPEEEAKKAKEEDFNNSVKMLESGRNITRDLDTAIRGVPGTKRINPKETKIRDNRPYKEISDEELQAKVRRLQLERQYGDLSGDAQYIQTGKEKTREYLQTVGALLGIGISALTIYKFIKDKK